VLPMDKDIVLTTACEIDVVQHCNLACLGCSHLSPILSRGYVDPDRLYADLCGLACHFHVEHARLLGGEPLLHPRLLEVIDATRRSGIADKVRVLTNGTLLRGMPNTFWKSVDQLYVSIYPGMELPPEQRRLFREKASVHGVDLRLFRFDFFRVSHSEKGTADRSLVRRIYTSCQIAHQWACHNICDGYFYKCPQSAFLPRLLGGDSRGRFEGDRVRIDRRPGLEQELRAFLQAPEPLASCSFCLGSVGKLFPHAQVTRNRWRHLQQAPTESLIDLEHLYRLEHIDPDADNMCLRPEGQ
jgi:GTP 3',8-cyclase